MRRALAIAALIACGLITARCATEGTAGGYYDPYYYDDPWYGYGYGFGAGIIVGGCCDDTGPPPHPEHPIVNPPGGDRPGAPHPEHPIANVPGATPKAETRPSGGSSSSRPTPAPRSAAPSRGGGGFSGGGGRGGGGGRR